MNWTRIQRLPQVVEGRCGLCEIWGQHHYLDYDLGPLCESCVPHCRTAEVALSKAGLVPLYIRGY